MNVAFNKNSFSIKCQLFVFMEQIAVANTVDLSSFLSLTFTLTNSRYTVSEYWYTLVNKRDKCKNTKYIGWLL